MSWKNIKDTFAILHNVQIENGNVIIGSGYVRNLLTIDAKTGKITENGTFHNFLNAEYPALAKAAPSELVKLIAAPDTFAQSITVYTYDGGEIIEKQCEATGWPNVTHDGEMMYENMFSTDKATVVSWAKRNATLGVKFMDERIADAEKELAELRTRRVVAAKERAKLDAAYPTIEAAR